jgi:hypothetical protein
MKKETITLMLLMFALKGNALEMWNVSQLFQQTQQLQSFRLISQVSINCKSYKAIIVSGDI